MGFQAVSGTISTAPLPEKVGRTIGYTLHQAGSTRDPGVARTLAPGRGAEPTHQLFSSSGAWFYHLPKHVLTGGPGAQGRPGQLPDVFYAGGTAGQETDHHKQTADRAGGGRGGNLPPGKASPGNSLQEASHQS